MVLAKVSIELVGIYFHSFEIFIIQIGLMVFCKPDFITIKSNYFQNTPKGECFLDNFEGLVGERRFRALELQNCPLPHCVDFARYYVVAKCHFEGSEFRK
jgi:hypothetical protein